MKNPQTPKDPRSLPKHRDATIEDVTVAAPIAVCDTEVEVDLVALAEQIKESLASPLRHMLSTQSPMLLSVAAEFLKEFCKNIPSIQVTVPQDSFTAVSGCMHSLFFCIGTALHYAAASADAVHVRTESTAKEASILLETDLPADSRAAVFSCFGIDAERLFILQALAKGSGFSISTQTGLHATLVFTMQRTTPPTYLLRAESDPHLHAAFLLPLSYFVY